MTGFLHEKEFLRKGFLKDGGALLAGFSAKGAGAASRAQAADSPFVSSGPPHPALIDAWIMIHSDYTASVNAGRLEMRQDHPWVWR